MEKRPSPLTAPSTKPPRFTASLLAADSVISIPRNESMRLGSSSRWGSTWCSRLYATFCSDCL